MDLCHKPAVAFTEHITLAVSFQISRVQRENWNTPLTKPIDHWCLIRHPTCYVLNHPWKICFNIQVVKKNQARHNEFTILCLQIQIFQKIRFSWTKITSKLTGCWIINVKNVYIEWDVLTQTCCREKSVFIMHHICIHIQTALYITHKAVGEAMMHKD